MKPIDYVDLNRFMGDWYVIANIPTIFEKGAHNALENYRMNKKGHIKTTFTFHAGSFDGELKTYNPTGFVRDTTGNAIWDMPFIWPFKSDYRIVYLNEDYSQVVIARQARDYVWIMVRESKIEDKDYEKLKGFVSKLGYNSLELVKVPQRWTS